MQLSCLLTLLAVVGSKFAPSGENYSAYSIGKTLFSGVLEELQARHTAVAELAANDTDGWSRRRGAVRRILRRAFAPLAPETRSAPRSVITGNWPMAAGMWRAVAADFNRERRVQLVQSLQGLDVAVFGSDAWEEFCTGTIKYAGNVAYAEVPGVLATGRVCLAWGPTQFPHTFSERLLLSMASGCASVCEDRYLVRQHFGQEHCASFDPKHPTSARDEIESLLSSPDTLCALSAAGRTIVESHHLWECRVEKLAALASEAIDRPLAPQASAQSMTAGA